jgi:putative transposase
MSLHALRRGHRVRIGGSEFLILQRLGDGRWQLQNTVTGELCNFSEYDLLDEFVRNQLSFVVTVDDCGLAAEKLEEKIKRDLSVFPAELVAIARRRVRYLKAIDRQQPIPIVQETIDPLNRKVSEATEDFSPPSWRTVCRDYRKWVAAGRDIRAIILRYADRGRRGTRLSPEVKTISDQVIEELYMTAERKRVSEVYLEIVRRLAEANRFRSEPYRLAIPSRSTIYREIKLRSPYDIMAARYGKRRADMEFRLSGIGPRTSRFLERVVMDHTPSDIIVVDDKSMLPLGRPTITTALDEHTRCPMGFYSGFEPPSCLAVMRCLKHAILPKTYVAREFPSIKNQWDCYGVPELIVLPANRNRHSVRKGPGALVQGEARTVSEHDEPRLAAWKSGHDI